MEAKYYVYVYLDPRKKGEFIYGEYKFEYEPFYVGKGSGNRYLKHLTETKIETTNIFKFRILDKLTNLGLVPIILKIKIGLIESDAYKLETKLIKIIGRRCDKTGSLANIITDGKPPKNYKQLSGETIKKIIKKYNEGKYLKHIGNDLGLNENKVKRTLIENGINPKRKPPLNKINIDADKIIEIINNYKSGLSIRNIAKKYGLSFEVIRKTLKNNDVSLRGYNYPKTDEHIKKICEHRTYKLGEDNELYKTLTNEEILKLKDLRFNQHKSIKEIIKELKISQKKYYEYINL